MDRGKLHPNHFYCSLDGDWYLVTLPTTQMWARVQEAARSGAIAFPDGFCDLKTEGLTQKDQFILLEEKGSRVYFALSQNPGDLLAYWDTENGRHINAQLKDDAYWPTPVHENWNSIKNYYYNFRPMLIPLDRNGDADLRLISDENGAVVEGGSFFVRPYAQAPDHLRHWYTKSGDCPAVGSLQEDCVNISDTKPQPQRLLRWVVWNHCLISAQDLCICSIENMWHSKIPWPCEAVVRINGIEHALREMGILH